jgi:NADH pyrophosphatase NudC (nudix superfamily)
VTFGESYEDAAKRELIEEAGISASLRYLGKFTHYDPPENEMVAVFACNSDEPVLISKEESSGAQFCTKEEVDTIIALESAPWLRDGWKLARNKI